MSQANHTQNDLYNATRWGMPSDAIESLAEGLVAIWTRFRGCFKSKTHDTSHNARIYLQGLLTMERHRNYTNIERRVIGVHRDGQELQQFMSDSPWSAEEVFAQIQEEIS